MLGPTSAVIASAIQHHKVDFRITHLTDSRFTTEYTLVLFYINMFPAYLL